MQAEHPGFKLLPIAGACINPLHIVVERFGTNSNRGFCNHQTAYACSCASMPPCL